MEEVLRALYRLQQIDLELDELNDGGGDLPAEVDQLQKKIDELSAAMAVEEGKLRDLRESRTGANNAINDMRERVKMLNERLRTVRNNKEYEATTADIASAEEELLSMERSTTTVNTQEAMLIRDIETINRQREELVKEMDEKNDTLTTIRDTHADEINALRTAREEVAAQISEDLLKRYRHIRTAHDDAVVKVRKGACNGCYRAIPPQTLVEMRRSEQLFTCEHCGRIIVDEEVAASVSV